MSKRYAMVVEDGTITDIAVEDAPPDTVRVGGGADVPHEGRQARRLVVPGELLNIEGAALPLVAG